MLLFRLQLSSRLPICYYFNLEHAHIIEVLDERHLPSLILKRGETLRKPSAQKFLRFIYIRMGTLSQYWHHIAVLMGLKWIFWCFKQTKVRVNCCGHVESKAKNKKNKNKIKLLKLDSSALSWSSHTLKIWKADWKSAFYYSKIIDSYLRFWGSSF